MSLSHAKVYVFSDSVLCLGKVNQNLASNTVWEEKLSWFKDSPLYRTLDTIDGNPMEFEWNIFPRFTKLQLVDEVRKFTKWAAQRNSEDELSSCCIWKKISSRTLVIPRTWIRYKVVFYLQRKTTRRMGHGR